MIHTTMPWLDKRIDRLKVTNSLPREDVDELVEVIILLEMKLRALASTRERCLPCNAEDVLTWLRTRGRRNDGQ